MTKYFVIIIFLISTLGFSQKEGQNFCEGDSNESYFSLLHAKKYIIWSDTYYSEESVGEKEIGNKKYIEYKQAWESGDTASLFLREENGVVYQYEACCEEDTIRLPAELKVGYKWKTADNLSEYEIISIDSELKTPICNYKNVLIIKLTVKNGSFQFYYLKGFGYIGATINDEIISFVTPQKPTKD